MARLDKEREKKLQPKRIEFAKKQIENLGYTITEETDTSIKFEHKMQNVTYFPYSGWHTGKSIQDGRGWKKLKEQLEIQQCRRCQALRNSYKYISCINEYCDQEIITDY